MAFDANQTEQQITHSMGAMLLLHASNQALIEVSITPSASSWYEVLNGELATVENLVVDWRQNGFLYFQQEILEQVVACGQAFTGQQAAIDTLFKKLEGDFSSDLKQQIVDKLKALDTPINAMTGQITAYSSRLAQYEKDLSAPLHQMEVTSAKIQAEAAHIQEDINLINAKIANLKKEVITDRRAIAKAKAARDRGIAETIFGILLAPFTGGASLILAGIGVGTIAEAEEKVHHLESTISSYQSDIASDQKSLNNDEKQISTLHGLTMSVEIAISDIKDINTALDSLRTTWNVLLGSLDNAVKDVDRAGDAKSALVGKVWYDAACATWVDIIAFAQKLANNNAPTPSHVQIG